MTIKVNRARLIKAIEAKRAEAVCEHGAKTVAMLAEFKEYRRADFPIRAALWDVERDLENL